MRDIKVLLAVVLVLGPWSANGALLFTFEEANGNVTAAMTGSLDTTGLTPNAPLNQISPYVRSTNARIATGIESALVQSYQALSGPGSFGNGATTFASASTGDAVFFAPDAGVLFLPSGYLSGATLNANLTFASQTFSSMGLFVGEYLYSFGTRDTVTIRIANSVPEPGTLALLGLGLAGLGLSRRRKAN